VSNCHKYGRGSLNSQGGCEDAAMGATCVSLWGASLWRYKVHLQMTHWDPWESMCWRRRVASTGG